MCHLFCEIGRRIEIAGVAKAGGYELPMTQERLRKVGGFNELYLHLDQVAA